MPGLFWTAVAHRPETVDGLERRRLTRAGGEELRTLVKALGIRLLRGSAACAENKHRYGQADPLVQFHDVIP